VSRGDDMWRFHPVISHGVQSGGNTWNLNIARGNLQFFFIRVSQNSLTLQGYKPINPKKNKTKNSPFKFDVIS
jgi:hypothetical protein